MRLFGRGGSGGKKDGGSSNGKSKDGPQDSVLQMRATIEMLEKRERVLLGKMKNEEDNARKLVTSNKREALMCLKRKHMYEGHLEQSRGARFNLESQMMAIENANINMETLKAMKAGSATMKNMHGELDVNKVDNTMDDIREQLDIASEINMAISQPLNADMMGMGGLDDDDLNEELERLEQSELDRTLLDVPQVISTPALSASSISGTMLPQAPSSPLTSPNAMAAASHSSMSTSAAAAADEDAELAELRQSMAL